MQAHGKKKKLQEVEVEVNVSALCSIIPMLCALAPKILTLTSQGELL